MWEGTNHVPRVSAKSRLTFASSTASAAPSWQGLPAWQRHPTIWETCSVLLSPGFYHQEGCCARQPGPRERSIRRPRLTGSNVTALLEWSVRLARHKVVKRLVCVTVICDKMDQVSAISLSKALPEGGFTWKIVLPTEKQREKEGAPVDVRPYLETCRKIAKINHFMYKPPKLVAHKTLR